MGLLVSGTAVELERSKVVVRFTVLSRKCEKNRDSLTFDSLYGFLVFIIVFEGNNTSINIIYNIHRYYMNVFLFKILGIL